MENNPYIVREGYVVSVDDSYDMKRIKVRVGVIDGLTSKIEDLPYCFPLMPKLVHIMPKVGEMVLVFLSRINSKTSLRYFIGPVLSQQYSYDKDSGEFIPKYTPVMEAPSLNKENDGTLPDIEDIAIIGRKNSDVILSDDEIKIRCGFKSTPDAIDPTERLKFNNKDMAYIQLKYKAMNNGTPDEFKSVINIVADRINLLSNDSSFNFDLHDKLLCNKEDEDGNDSCYELQRILDSAHKLVYGDLLVEFLKKFLEVFKNHEHPFSRRPLVIDEPTKNVLNTDLDSMVCETVHIN